MMTGGTYPMQKEGETAHYRYKMYQCRPPYCAAVTTECKNLEAAMTILDYGYCEPGWMMYNYGIEGLTYNMVDGRRRLYGRHSQQSRTIRRCWTALPAISGILVRSCALNMKPTRRSPRRTWARAKPGRKTRSPIR